MANARIQADFAKKCIEEMIANLHFEYDLAIVLHRIYLSMKKSLREGILENKKEARALQMAFLEAGTDILYAPTFSANRIKLTEYGLQEKLAENGVAIEFTQEFEDYMSTKGYEPAYGARPIKRLMQKELVNLLAKSILDGHVRRDSVIRVDVRDGQILIA